MTKLMITCGLIVAGVAAAQSQSSTADYEPLKGFGNLTNVTVISHGSSPDSFYALQFDQQGDVINFPLRREMLKLPSSPEKESGVGVPFSILGLKRNKAGTFFLGKYSEEGAPKELLVLVGSSFSDPNSSSVIVLVPSEKTLVQTALDEDALILTAFRADGPQGPEIIGKTTMSQVVRGEGGNGSKKPYATTYDPYSVYLLKDGHAAYSLVRSEAYNREHYVWAGPHSREDYAVLYNVPGHKRPFGGLTADLSKLMMEH